MITFDPGAGEPTRWIVCFSFKAATPWMNRLPVGRYKHVRAFGCVPSINTWVFVDPALDRTSVRIARGDPAKALMAEFLHEADAVGMPMIERKLMLPRLGGWCVPTIKHLIGLRSGALRPITLFDDCLRNGGEVIESAVIHPACRSESCDGAAAVAG